MVGRASDEGGFVVFFAKPCADEAVRVDEIFGTVTRTGDHKSVNVVVQADQSYSTDNVNRSLSVAAPTREEHAQLYICWYQG